MAGLASRFRYYKCEPPWWRLQEERPWLKFLRRATARATQRREHACADGDDQRRQRSPRSCAVPLPCPQSVGGWDYSETRIESFSGAGRARAPDGIPLRRRSSRRARRRRPRTDADRVPASRTRGVHHRRDRQHRRGPRRNADLRRIARRRRDRPARHPRAIRHGPQRLQVDPHQLRHCRRRDAAEAARDCRAAARRSAVYDVFANGVPVDVDVNVI